MVTKASKILIFSGTSEGHELARYMENKGILEMADFSVATEYGEQIMKDVPDANIIMGPMNLEEMTELLYFGNYGIVIDGTHPFAQLASENIRRATEKTNVTYLRLIRDEEDFTSDGNIIIVDSIGEAVEELNKTDEKFLLSTGVKDLPTFSKILDFQNRAVARVLPFISSIQACNESGVKNNHIIAMQGPFSEELNVATMNQYGLTTLVTKSTGKAGGLAEKLSVAKKGYKVIVIGRPVKEVGLSLEEVMERLDGLYE